MYKKSVGRYHKPVKASRKSEAYAAAASARRATRTKLWRAALEPGLANLAVRGLQLAPGELKSIDTRIGWSPMLFAAGGTYALLNGIAKGDDIFQRTGRQITMKSIDINLVMETDWAVPTVAAAIIPPTARVILFIDTQANCAAPQTVQLLEHYTTRNVVTSHFNLDYRSRFVVLADFLWSAPCVGTATNTNPPPAKHRHIYRKLNVPVMYNGVDNLIGSIATNSLYLWYCSTELTASHVQPFLTYDARLRYLDN